MSLTQQPLHSSSTAQSRHPPSPPPPPHPLNTRLLHSDMHMKPNDGDDNDDDDDALIGQHLDGKTNGNGDIDVPTNGHRKKKVFVCQSDAILKPPFKRLHFAQRDGGGGGEGEIEEKVEEEEEEPGDEGTTTAKRMRTEQNGSSFVI